MQTGFLMGKQNKKRPQKRPRRRLEDNIKMVLGEIVFGGMSWIHAAQGKHR
jgi:hypothetical protein